MSRKILLITENTKREGTQLIKILFRQREREEKIKELYRKGEKIMFYIWYLVIEDLKDEDVSCSIKK